MVASTADPGRLVRSDDLPIERICDHVILRDCLLYHSTGSQSALIFVPETGDTHYLEPADVALLFGASATLGVPLEEADHPARLDELRQRGLVRKSGEGQS